MKAVEVSHTGGPEVLEYHDVPEPQLKATEALVRIEAAGLNFIDVYFREGRYPSNLPFIVGQEAAGIVEKVGSDVTTVKPGHRVAYTGLQGAYAEKSAVAADRLVKIPDGVSFEQAAALMLQGMTAHYLVKSTYPLKSGETCLIHAAAGGVGQLLVQMAKMIDTTVIATAGTDEKCDIVRRLGADHVINYDQQDFETETKRLTGGKGVHVVYDGVGKTTFEKGLNVLRPRGYMVLFGGASGAVPPFDLIKLSQKGSLYVTRPTLAAYIATREELEWRASDVMGWVASGKLKISIGQTYPLAEAEKAHRDLEGRKTTGKTLLIP
ncbi:MAG: quinone oxidoreductase [Terriglobia bacterium]|jgi:NADPH2:quinone reductase|nr:quinone oxidoreductase [Terriglobia bacterium]